MSWLLLALAALPQEQGSPFLKPAWSRLAVPRAVDHVAVMTLHREWGPPGEDRMTLTRSGPWLREDIVENGHASTAISNVATGFSYRYALMPDGSVPGFTITGAVSATRQTIRKTRETDRLVEESCTVWTFSWDQIVERNCLTHDGILLWQKVIANDHELSSARAVSIVRRKVAPAEVALPAGLLDLSAWGGWPPVTATGDAVWLTGPRHTVVLRRLGTYAMRDEILGDGRRQRSFLGDGITIIVSERDGRLDRLDLSRMPNTTDGMVPILPEQRKTILGQPCTMFRDSPGGLHHARFQCRASDGLVLEETTYTRASGNPLTATRIVRGQKLTDMAPPPNLLRTVR